MDLKIEKSYLICDDYIEKIYITEIKSYDEKLNNLGKIIDKDSFDNTCFNTKSVLKIDDDGIELKYCMLRYINLNGDDINLLDLMQEEYSNLRKNILRNILD